MLLLYVIVLCRYSPELQDVSAQPSSPSDCAVRLSPADHSNNQTNYISYLPSFHVFTLVYGITY